MATNSELKPFRKAEVFQVGEVWESPRGTLYLVMHVIGRNAVLRTGTDGSGRILRRWQTAFKTGYCAARPIMKSEIKKWMLRNPWKMIGIASGTFWTLLITMVVVLWTR